MTCWSRTFAASLLFFAVSVSAEPPGAGVVWALGEEPHHGAEKSSAHLAAMQRLKEQIPEEYRLMDRTPVTPTRQSLARGEELYLRLCAACHGQGGQGDGPAAAAMDPRPANFLDLEHSAIYGPGEKYWVIGNGYPATGMPGFARQLAPGERWDLVNFILSLQEKAPRKGHGH